LQTRLQRHSKLWELHSKLWELHSKLWEFRHETPHKKKKKRAPAALAGSARVGDIPNSARSLGAVSEGHITLSAAPGTPPVPQLYTLDSLLSVWDAEATAANVAYVSGQRRGPATSLPTLDRDIGGFLATGVHIAHGSPGVGKSAWVLQTAADCGFPALVVTTEMSALELFRRHTARKTGTFLGKLKSGELDPAQSLALACRAAAAAPTLALADATTCFAAPDWIKAAATGLRARFKAAHMLIVVDSVHSWSEQSDSNLSEYDRLNAALLALGNLARALDVPILAVAERNRMSMSAGGMSASAGTRKFEYAAESVFELNREKDTPPDAAGEVPLTLTLSKNRNGSPGRTIKLKFHGALQRFREE
jgi:replicative DNA helicase